MATHTNTRHSSRVIETFFVGAAMKSVSAEIMHNDVPVHTRHMRSIDDLLVHVEDHQVECAVIDQSRPTESRGIKLVLLAGIKKVKHLIVIASPNSRTEIASIEGVHKVLASPISHEQIIASVFELARPAEPKPVTATGNRVSAHKAAPGNAPWQAASRFMNFRNAMTYINRTRHKYSQYNMSKLGNRLQSRPVMATVASVFACLGTLAALSLASDSSVLLVDKAGKQAIAQQSGFAADEAAGRPSPARQALGQTDSALQAAELSRRQSASRMQVSLRMIELEIVQQSGLRKDVLANISRLNAIVLDLKTRHSKNSSAPTHRPGSLNTHKRLAQVKIELALQELELSKIDNVLGNLNLLKSRIGPPETQTFKLADIGSSGISK